MATDTFWIVVAGVFGAVFGSFLNVCIVRLPADQSVLRPRSRCPKCSAPIAWYDNVPIVSWLLLRGRCRRCAQPIAVRYPLVEAAVAAVWAGAVWHYGVDLTALTAAVFATLLIGIAVTDASHLIIPDEFSLGGLPLGLALSLRDGVPGLTAAALGAAVGFGLLFLVAWAGEKVFRKEAMGGGDIKMMAMVGAFVGWKGVLLTIFGGALLGTIVFVPLTIGGRKSLVPFGVFLAAAAALTFVFGEAIIGWYVTMTFGPS
ncbi:MAG: prepilin peptidase [Gemmatimonadota bacterium]|nr:prepilin peptidase [Gemmatimonadota bacterium]MDH3368737.1 prepilin peptidase [Gemmatimonadota bacterium]MDH3477434.1 prepilin peptidase [Gemmatimonadota bacterium]MDH3569563.1 prepilin peptidase [Gemmatimonadota bacterium]MDH5549072.1 prepilin peptidase [Gemmatimonadota bacterium]